MSECNCDLHKRNRRFEAILSKYNMDKEERDFLEGLNELLMNLEGDEDNRQLLESLRKEVRLVK